MEWLVQAKSDNVHTNEMCVIRKCDSKSYCEDYFCGVLYCGTNK